MTRRTSRCKGAAAPVPGTIYKNGNRYWWSVKLPGEEKRRARPLKAQGARYATRDLPIAEAIARETWQAAVAAAARREGNELDVTLAILVAKYIRRCRLYYRNADGGQTSEAESVEYAVRPLTDRWPAMLAADFSIKHLLEVREWMISGKWPEENEPTHRCLARTTINKRIRQIVRMFRWAGGEAQLMPSWVWYNLTTVEDLKPGRSQARETPDVEPVADWIVEATLPFLPPTVQAMVGLHRLTGMRSSELCAMTPADIDRRKDIWVYGCRQYKGRHLAGKDKPKLIPLGPQAQAFLEPLLAGRPPHSPVFSPAEATDQRNQAKRLRRRTPVQASQQDRRKADPQVTPGDRYDRRSYYTAVQHAIKAANRRRQADAEIAGHQKWIKVPKWHPHQLRHAAASQLTEQANLKAASAVLGHATMAMTAHYARSTVERIALAHAIEMARQFG